MYQMEKLKDTIDRGCYVNQTNLTSQTDERLCFGPTFSKPISSSGGFRLYRPAIFLEHLLPSTQCFFTSGNMRTSFGGEQGGVPA